MYNDLLNLDMMEYIWIRDNGENDKERFEIVGETSGDDYTIKKYRTEEGARKFLKKLYEQSKIEISE
jgi:hypothetical protein